MWRQKQGGRGAVRIGVGMDIGGVGGVGGFCLLVFHLKCVHRQYVQFVIYDKIGSLASQAN